MDSKIAEPSWQVALGLIPPHLVETRKCGIVEVFRCREAY